MKVLIVEDNQTNMKFVADLLRRSGYDVLQANDAETGIALSREKLPDVILMDIQLPGMDGMTAAKAIRNDAKTAKIKIIAVTAFAMNGDRERMLEAGFDGYIPKPVRYRVLLDELASISGKGGAG